MRKPIVDGIFYPADKSTLKTKLEELLAGVQSQPGKADAILVPHAGYS
ncbi:MAG: AmmeMemoRadiSam system protein B [Spirochaetia bacterium]|nr:AmmeMemoRadiSam system protein B [Spirochaetia bacterium]